MAVLPGETVDWEGRPEAAVSAEVLWDLVKQFLLEGKGTGGKLDRGVSFGQVTWRRTRGDSFSWTCCASMTARRLERRFQRSREKSAE